MPAMASVPLEAARLNEAGTPTRPLLPTLSSANYPLVKPIVNNLVSGSFVSTMEPKAGPAATRAAMTLMQMEGGASASATTGAWEESPWRGTVAMSTPAPNQQYSPLDSPAATATRRDDADGGGGGNSDDDSADDSTETRSLVGGRSTRRTEPPAEPPTDPLAAAVVRGMFELEGEQWRAQEEERAAARAAEAEAARAREEADALLALANEDRRVKEQDRIFAQRDREALVALAIVAPKLAAGPARSPPKRPLGADGRRLKGSPNGSPKSSFDFNGYHFASSDSDREGGSDDDGDGDDDADDFSLSGSELDPEEAAELAAQEEARRWIEEQVAKRAEAGEEVADTARLREEAQIWIEQQRREGAEAARRQVIVHPSSLFLSSVLLLFLFIFPLSWLFISHSHRKGANTLRLCLCLPHTHSHTRTPDTQTNKLTSKLTN